MFLSLRIGCIGIKICLMSYMTQTPVISLSDPYGGRGFKNPLNTKPVFVGQLSLYSKWGPKVKNIELNNVLCGKVRGSIQGYKGKVNCTLVQALGLCIGCTAHRESRGIALLFHDHGIRRGWGVSVTSRPLFTHGKDPVPIVQEAGWAPGPVWTGAKNLSPYRDLIPGPSSP
jgi:hypothetical protein